MVITELAVLKWLHILAMVYWLGGEWGVFNTSTHVINRELSMEERRRHMQTAYHIDILARIGIITLLPLGLHMGTFWGVQPYDGWYLVAMWVFVAGWLALCISAYIHRETDLGIRLTIYDEKVRYVIIPLLLVSSLASIAGYGPFNAGPGQYWFSIKMFLYSGALMIGLKLRFVMREWTDMFRILAEGANAAVETKLEKVWPSRSDCLFLLGAHCNGWLFWRHENDLGSGTQRAKSLL